MKPFEQIFSELLPQLEELELSRQEQYKSAKKWLNIAIGLGIATVVVLLFVRHPATIFIGGLIAAAVYFLGYYPKEKRYKNEFKDKVFHRIIQAVNPNLVYNKSHYISKEKFFESKIFTNRADHYSGEDLISGTVDKTEIIFSELKAEEKRNSGKHTHYVTFFKGLFMIADFHKNFHGHTIVLPDTAEKVFGFLGKKLQNWNFTRDEVVHMENAEFEKEFVVYSNDQVEARYILSTSMIQRILDLKKKYNTNVYLSFINSKVFVAMQNNNNLFEPKFKESITNSDYIRTFYSELCDCLSIVDDLNLNTRIWSK
ncbi:MAG: DUF3137 domain-containing protein [Bacteroidia bacterium]